MEIHPYTHEGVNKSVYWFNLEESQVLRVAYREILVKSARIANADSKNDIAIEIARTDDDRLIRNYYVRHDTAVHFEKALREFIDNTHDSVIGIAAHGHTPDFMNSAIAERYYLARVAEPLSESITEQSGEHEIKAMQEELENEEFNIDDIA